MDFLERYFGFFHDHGDGSLTGNFPGSPATLEFSFVIEGEKITALQIQ